MSDEDNALSVLAAIVEHMPYLTRVMETDRAMRTRSRAYGTTMAGLWMAESAIGARRGLMLLQ